MLKDRVRATQSDKKQNLRTKIPISLTECINQISYITNLPMKNLCGDICEAGIVTKKVVEQLSEYFHRSIWLDHTLYRGDIRNPSIKEQTPEEPKKRIIMCFAGAAFENIKVLAYALDVTPTTAAAFLLEVSVMNADFMNKFVRQYLNKHMDDRKIRGLKKVMKFNNTHTYYEEEVSWNTVLSYLFDDMKMRDSILSQTI